MLQSRLWACFVWAGVASRLHIHDRAKLSIRRETADAHRVTTPARRVCHEKLGILVRFPEGLHWWRDGFANHRLVEHYEPFYLLQCALLILILGKLDLRGSCRSGPMMVREPSPGVGTRQIGGGRSRISQGDSMTSLLLLFDPGISAEQNPSKHTCGGNSGPRFACRGA